MDIRHLRYFVAVAETLSFSEAARRLHMSQPPLSQRIRELEVQLGTCLFLREAGRVDLSPQGMMLLPRARQLLTRYEAARVLMQTDLSHTAAEPIQIVSCAPIGSPAVLTALEVLSTANIDRYRFETLSANECLEALRLNKAQLAIGPLPKGNDPEHLSFVLHKESLAIAMPEDHQLAKSTKVSLVDLVGERWLLPQSSSAPAMNERFQLACRQIGLTPRLSHQRVYGTEHALALVALGYGITLVPEALVGASLARVKVAPLLRPRILIEHVAQISQNPPQALKMAFHELKDRIHRSQAQAA